MRVIICGSRGWRDPEAIWQAMGTLPAASVVIHGGAIGVDRIAGAEARHLGLEEVTYLAEWDVHGRMAGPIRNRKMLDEAKPDEVWAFWDGKSRGTKHMINISRAACVKVRVFYPEIRMPKADSELLKAEREAIRRYRSGERLRFSTGICDSLTYGYGRLDGDGYWQYPVPYSALSLEHQQMVDEIESTAFRKKGSPDA